VLDNLKIRYIDSNFSGTSTGSRSAPFRNFKDSGFGTGEPGLAYLFRRGTTYVEDRIYLKNGENDEKMIFGAWGQGDRPIFNGNSKDLVLMSLGSWYGVEYPESDKCYNVDVYDFDIRDFGAAGGPMIGLSRSGHTFNFYRIRISGGTSSHTGAIYFMCADPRNELYDSNIYMQDIESFNNDGRGIKIEAGGVLVENFKDSGSDSTPISAGMTPNVTLRYIHLQTSEGVTGPNLRQYDQYIEWAYITGFYRAIFVMPTMDIPGYGPWPLNRNAIRNVIIDGTRGNSGITMTSGGAASNVPENLLIERVLVRGATSSGIHIRGSAVNTNIRYSLVYGNQNGISIDEGVTGTRIHNSIVVDNLENDLVVENGDGHDGELINTIFDSKVSHFATESTNYILADDSHFVDRSAGNYRPSANAPYVGSGTPLGYNLDLDGQAVGDPPTIGCYEYVE
jgi:hypothetical protein